MDFEKLNPLLYDELLDKKIMSFKELFKGHDLSNLDVYASAKAHFRMRAEFRVWHEGDDFHFIMFDQATKERVITDQFLPAGLIINQTMLLLREELKNSSLLKNRLFQVDFLSTTLNEILVSLLYHKDLSFEWEQEAKDLKDRLEKKLQDRNAFARLDLIGRCRKKKLVFNRDFVMEELWVHHKRIRYQQIENSFTQPNAGLAASMLTWSYDQLKNVGGDLVELYCGNGHFSLALAPLFNKVFATEISRTSIEAALFNCDENQITNVHFARLSSEEFARAFLHQEKFSRLQDVDFSSFDLRTILVDPPRQGLDDKTIQLVAHFENILYISCHPETLLLNLEELSKTHEIKRTALFDQFPYTHHIESGVFLVKKK